MDVDLEKRINEAIAAMQQILPEAVDIYQLDPMAKIMLVALVNETSKIQDYVDGPRDMNALPGLDCKLTYGVGCENERCPCTPFTDDDYQTPQEAAAAWNRRSTENEVSDGLW